MGKRVITVEDIVQAAQAGHQTIPCPPGDCIITPGARDQATLLGVFLDEGDGSAPPLASTAGISGPGPTDDLIQQVCAALQPRLPVDIDQKNLETLVRDVVTTRLAPSGPLSAEGGDQDSGCPGGIVFVSGQRLLLEGARPIPVAEKVLVADAIKCGDGYKLSAGVMAWEKTSFDRTVDFPEIGVILEGELHLIVAGKTIIGKPGDVLYFPQGVHVVYSTPTKVKLACVNCIQ